MFSNKVFGFIKESTNNMYSHVNNFSKNHLLLGRAVVLLAACANSALIGIRHVGIIIERLAGAAFNLIGVLFNRPDCKLKDGLKNIEQLVGQVCASPGVVLTMAISLIYQAGAGLYDPTKICAYDSVLEKGTYLTFKR